MNAVGFSNGCAEFAFAIPPPFVPSSLIASWLAIGRPEIAWVAPSTVVAPCRAAEGLHDALAREQRARRRRERQQHAGRRRVRSTQKFPIVAERRRVSPRIERDGDGDPDRGGGEVLHGQPGHLGQVAHRRLAAVVLPVRVRDEARPPC